MKIVTWQEAVKLIEQELKKLRDEFRNASQKDQERAIILALQQIRLSKVSLVKMEEEG